MNIDRIFEVELELTNLRRNIERAYDDYIHAKIKHKVDDEIESYQEYISYVPRLTSLRLEYNALLQRRYNAE